jgi:hypothetical protein
MTTTYAIAKRSAFNDSAIYVTTIRSDYRVVSERIADEDLPKLRHIGAHMRTWATQAAADAMLDKLATIGGYDDYMVVALEGAPA